MATKKKPYVPDFEISTPLVMDKKWTFRWNDETISFEQFQNLSEDHKQWIKDQEKAAAAANAPERKTRKKK